MAGTSAVAVKSALVSLLTGAPGLEDVQVSYGYDGRTETREMVYGGLAEWDTTLLTMRSAMTRAQRKESGTVDVHVFVSLPGGDAQAAETRAAEIGTVVEELLALNQTLDDLPTVKLGTVAGGQVASAPTDDEMQAVLTYRVSFMSVLD